MSDSGSKRAKRTYRPGVEALEALRLLAIAAPLPAIFPVAIDAPAVTTGPESSSFGDDAWDAALFRTRVSDLIGTKPIEVATDPQSIASGISQLDR